MPTKVLIVEDDELLGDGIRAVLAQSCGEANWVTDGVAAEAALRERAERSLDPEAVQDLASYLHHAGRTAEGAALLGDAVERFAGEMFESMRDVPELADALLRERNADFAQWIIQRMARRL